MTQTLRRELRQTIFEVLEKYYQDNPPSEDASSHNRDVSVIMADEILELRAFKPSEPLSKEDVDFVNKKVDTILALNEPSKSSWRGRENFRDNHLVYADWWNETTNQVCGKRQQKSWQKAFSEWYDEGLDVASLKESYNQDITWKNVIADPNEITKKAVAIMAANSKKQPRREPTVDANGIPVSY